MPSLVEELDLTGHPQLRGLTDAEIDEVTRDQGVTSLPPRYVEFLQVMGRDAGPLFRGTDAFYPRLLGIKGYAVELLEENGVGGLMPPDAVVFAMHQGYQFFWMSDPAAVDPPVRFYLEGETSWTQEWPSFTDCLLRQMSFDRRSKW